MKVLFVSSGNKDGTPKEVVHNQGDSISRNGIEIRYFCVEQRGISGYLKSVKRLRKELKDFHPDIIHAHYSFCGFLAWMAGSCNLVVSLMGSDARMNFVHTGLIKFFSMHIWTLTIVKSADMRNRLNLPKALIIPNGVDIERFKKREIKESLLRSGLEENKKNILFAADPLRPEKNIGLARESVDRMNRNDLNLVTIYDIPNPEMSYFYSAADILILTSLWEGSPNVIKEAMACDLPIVSTNVGDVEDLLNGVAGCHICTSDSETISEKIAIVLESGSRTDGRKKILEMHLDSVSIALKIIKEYNKILNS
jgi:teichuronic acid biosynthesis glycosyltransferase TuaC